MGGIRVRLNNIIRIPVTRCITVRCKEVALNKCNAYLEQAFNFIYFVFVNQEHHHMIFFLNNGIVVRLQVIEFLRLFGQPLLKFWYRHGLSLR